MTYEEKVRWLRRYQEELKREKELSEELWELKDRAERINSCFNDMPASKSKSDKLQTAVEDIIEAEAKLISQIKKSEEIKNEIIETIESLENRRYKVILRYRYIVGMNWEAIAEKSELSSKWCKTLHDRALMLIG